MILHHNFFNSKAWGLGYKELLDEKDPIDKLILELADKGELKVGTVEVKGEKWRFFKNIYLTFYLIKKNIHLKKFSNQ